MYSIGKYKKNQYICLYNLNYPFKKKYLLWNNVIRKQVKRSSTSLPNAITCRWSYPLGICFGVVLGQWGLDNLATGIAVGMCLGVGIGICFKKKKKE